MMIDDIEIRKLCANCAYRVNCIKRFGVTIVNGEVKCIDYSADVEIINRLKKELAEKKNSEE